MGVDPSALQSIRERRVRWVRQGLGQAVQGILAGTTDSGELARSRLIAGSQQPSLCGACEGPLRLTLPLLRVAPAGRWMAMMQRCHEAPSIRAWGCAFRWAGTCAGLLAGAARGCYNATRLGSKSR